MKSKLFVATALAAAACTPAPHKQDEPTPVQLDASSAALTANTNIAGHLDGLAQAILFLKESDFAADLLPREAVPPCAPGENCVEPDPEPDVDLREEAKEIEADLAKYIFNQANFESQDGAAVIFRLKPEVACNEYTDESGQTTRDADCVKTLTAVPVRLRVSSFAQGDLEIALTVTDQAAGKTWAPGTITLHDDTFGFDVSLADLKGAVITINNANGESSEDAPAVFEGRVRATVRREAAGKYTGTLGVVEQVRVSNFARTDKRFYDVKVAPAPAAFTVTLDANAKTISSAADAKAFDLEAALDLLAGDDGSDYSCPPPDPYNPMPCDPPPPPEPLEGVVSVHLGGASGAATFAGQTDTFTFTGLGLGADTTSVKYEGATIFALDINKTAGRRFDLTVRRTDAGVETSVSPSFQLDLVRDLRSLQSQLDDLEAWAVQGTDSVKLDGAAPAVLFLEQSDSAEPMPDDGSGSGSGPVPDPGPGRYVKVTGGKLTLNSSALTTPIEIAAGQCLIESDYESDQPHHPFLNLASGTCE